MAIVKIFMDKLATYGIINMLIFSVPTKCSPKYVMAKSEKFFRSRGCHGFCSLGTCTIDTQKTELIGFRNEMIVYPFNGQSKSSMVICCYSVRGVEIVNGVMYKG